MNIKASKRYAKNKRAKQQKKQLVTYLAITLIAIAIVTAGIFAFRANAQRPSSEPQVATFANPDNPECPYETPLVERLTEAVMETHLELDLSQGGTAHNVNLIVPSSETAFLTDGRIKQASELQVEDTIYMTGDKVGVVQSVEHELYTPEPVQTDGKGNVYSRVLGKSERYVETMLYLHTENEVIKTTPEHPFYVNGVYVEAQYLNPGDQIRTRTGKTIAVERTEIIHDPQMVYSLMVEGTHNFYVGEQGLLAHNCTSVLRKLTPAEIAGNTRIFPDQDVININDLSNYIDDMSKGQWNWNQMSTKIRIGRAQDGSMILVDGHHRFLAAQYTNTPIPESAIEYFDLTDSSYGYTWDMVEWVDN